VKSIIASATKRREIPLQWAHLVGSVVFSLLITIGAFVYIPLPFTPVPITLQVLFVLLCGVLLGSRYGTLSVSLYVAAGILGLPVFAGAYGGFLRILGPTGGYIVGFLIAPSVVSFLFRITGRRTLSAVAAMCGGLCVIYCTGVVHLSLFCDYHFLNAVRIGVIPFVVGDLCKIFLASILIHTLRRRVWNS
jgi:biotin transport system substrate-specific component